MQQQHFLSNGVLSAIKASKSVQKLLLGFVHHKRPFVLCQCDGYHVTGEMVKISLTPKMGGGGRYEDHIKTHARNSFKKHRHNDRNYFSALWDVS